VHEFFKRFRLETEFGEIDASIRSQIELMKETLLEK